MEELSLFTFPAEEPVKSFDHRAKHRNTKTSPSPTSRYEAHILSEHLQKEVRRHAAVRTYQRTHGMRPETVVCPPADMSLDENELNAAGAEAAVAELLGIVWGKDSAHERDAKRSDVHIGKLRIDVRWTTNPSRRLYLKPRDAKDRPFVFVTGIFPTFTAHHWVYPRDVWAHPSCHNWLVKRGGFGVGKNVLVPYDFEGKHHMDELQRLVEEARLG
jgi:hypothetical protein